MLKTTPIGKALGAVIHGVDLRPPISDALFSALHAELRRHQVVVLRGQTLSDEEHQALGWSWKARVGNTTRSDRWAP